MECNKEKNMSRCSCSYDPCSRKGICCECVAYHVKKRQIPACFFPDNPERTYDRSFQHFACLLAEGKI